MTPPIKRLSAEQFKAKTPTDRMWALYDSLWSCHQDHEDRIVALEQRNAMMMALVASGASIITALIMVAGNALIGG